MHKYKSVLFYKNAPAFCYFLNKIQIIERQHYRCYFGFDIFIEKSIMEFEFSKNDYFLDW